VTATATPALATARASRIVAVDAFRGLTVAGMLLVNDPGSWGHIFPPLAHAAWNGWTPADLIFPFFLFIVGITTHLSLSARRARGDDDRALLRQIVRRGLLIVAIGLLVSWFPFFSWGPIPGVADPDLGTRIVDRLLHVRIPGILQRIGVVYLACGLLTWRTSVRTQIAIVGAILLGYWALLTLVPVPDSGLPGWAVLDTPAATIAAWVDRTLLDWSAFGWGNHIWAETKTWDPEGPLSTLPAIATAMLGVLAGRWLSSSRPLADRLNGMFAGGAMAAAVGCVWGWGFAINKNLWTSSFVLFTAGLAAVTLGVCIWLIDVQGVRHWATPWVIFGANPIVAFVGSDVLARLIYSVITVPTAAGRISLEVAVYRTAYASWMEPRLASLAFAVSFTLLWFGVLSVLYRRGIFVRV
jgi:predicted acyltransferase